MLKLRSISRMKYFLSKKQIQILVQSLVISSLDYCNALYIGISSNLLNQLQKIQNSACRVIVGIKRRESISEHLYNLHWLKVKERIDFKVLLYVFKSLHDLAPCYLSNLLVYNDNSRTPSLFVPPTKSCTGNRAFSVAGPRLWNELPRTLKCCNDINIFKKELKHFLFRKSYNI